jgi:predicted Na+-dependent transporter
MSDLASAHRAPSAGRLSYAAVAFALGSAAAWILAGMVDDSLYVVTGALGIVAFGLGLRASRQAKRLGARRWPALAATIVGGLLGAAVIAFSIVWAISELV